MEIFLDPTIWLGLCTLVVIEIVLGIDNLVFIAILADKLPPQHRDRARVFGLGLALGIRLVLLAFISHMVTLTAPVFEIFDHPFSGRDLILLGGGAFLLWKSTTEIHGRIEGHGDGRNDKGKAKFWVVVAQIVVLDAVFSMDAVITAVGMVEHLLVMQAAVVIAMSLMIFASKPLTKFVSAHPTVIMLCLGFLLLVGFSLVADGMGYHMPKGYLYAAIGFSVLIEAFNQTSTIKRRQRIQSGSGDDMRQRTADAVLRILGGKSMTSPEMAEDVSTLARYGAANSAPVFSPIERKMIAGVLQLTERPIRSIMTPRGDLMWIDMNDPPHMIMSDLRSTPHSNIIVSRGGLDEIVGILRKADLIAIMEPGELPDIIPVLKKALIVHENLSVLKAVAMFKETPTPMAIIVDEYGSVHGAITLNDIIETIAGHIPNDEFDTGPDMKVENDFSVMMDGMMSIYDVKERLHIHDLPDEGFTTLAGFILYRLGHVPKIGESISWPGWEFTVMEMDKNKIVRVRVKPAPETNPGKA